ncbi:MAG TPA: hypothetical protein VGL89_00260 [Candidatus Koribacter sp.]|jgi:hypothetical protein
MTEEDFRRNYEQMAEDELVAVLADRKDLAPEAAAALDEVVKRRGTKLPEPTRWMRSPESNEQVYSLEDYPEYQELCRRQAFSRRYYHAIAMAPIFVAVAIAGFLGKTSFLEKYAVLLVSIAGTWVALVLIFSGSVFLQFFRFKCPQCRRRFGSRAECFSCEFPRSRSKR